MTHAFPVLLPAATDSGCYSKCFCQGVKKAVAVLFQANVDRKGPMWQPCMKTTWGALVLPHVPEAAVEAWRKQSCKATQKCTR